MKFTSTLAALGLASSASSCLLPREIEAEREYARTGVYAPRPEPRVKRATNAYPIGTGDRFNSGSTVPVGLGVNDRTLNSILNVAEVTSALKGLASGFPDDVELFTPPYKTVESRELPGAIVGDNPRVFIMSGIHARERGGPDAVIYFLADLLAAKKAGTGVKYGSKSYTNADVTKALSAGVIIIPLTNPDGVAYDQSTSTCWRKNRNTKSSGGSSSKIGVDLNRNYDFLWDYKTKFSSSADAPASDNPSSEVFYGSAAASEAETKAVVWTLDQYKNITFFMDLHSYAGDILYGWGDDDVGTSSTEQNLANTKYDGKRGVTGDTVYKEYLSSADFATEKSTVSQMTKSMNAVGGVTYGSYEAVGLYPTSGASNDYAMGRYYGKMSCGASRMFGYTLEFGTSSSADYSCPFYPNNSEFHRNIRQIGAGFMEMLLLAAGTAGDPLVLKC